MNKLKNKKISKALLRILMIVISIVFIFPLYYTLINSFISIYAEPNIIPPKELHFENYKYAVTLIPFFRYFCNSVIFVTISVILGVGLNFFYAYAFARLKGRYCNALFAITLSMMMIPGFAISIPQYIMFNEIGLKDTFWVLVVLGLAGGPHTIFLYRQYLLTFPKEIEEAAIIDGCGYFSIIASVYLPMCKAIIAVVFFNTFISSWNDYMTPFMFFSEKKYTLSIALFNASYTLPQNPELKLKSVVNAAALLLTLPVIGVFFMCQRQLVDGVIAGSVKG